MTAQNTRGAGERSFSPTVPIRFHGFSFLKSKTLKQIWPSVNFHILFMVDTSGPVILFSGFFFLYVEMLYNENEAYFKATGK